MKTLIPGPLKHLSAVKIFFVLICSCALVCAARGGTTKTQLSRPASSSGKPAASSGTQAPRAQAPQRRPTNVVQPAQGKPQIQHIQPPQHVPPLGDHPP